MLVLSAGMDQVGLGKNTPFGWVVIVAFVAALFGGGGKLVQASSIASKIGGCLFWALGTFIAFTVSSGQFRGDNRS